MASRANIPISDNIVSANLGNNGINGKLCMKRINIITIPTSVHENEKDKQINANLIIFLRTVVLNPFSGD
jgi:hypothetical protein